MSMLEDLYSEDLIGDPENLERDETNGPLFMEDEANEQDDGEAENDYVSQTVPQSDNPVQPKKKKVVKNPQPKLNPERLKGPRGVAILENVFQDFKFCGKGYEKRDLNEVMKRLEHWAHRLFPKYQFDDCLEKIETLGHKKPVMTYVKKIRMGLETAESFVVEPVVEDVEDELALPFDPFDELLSQQISESQSQQISTSQRNIPPASPPHSCKTTLTEEQRQRMERNRLIAQERRLARLKALQESQSKKSTEPLVENVPVFTATSERNSDTDINMTEQTTVLDNTEILKEEENMQNERIQETPIPIEENMQNERIQETPIPMEENMQNERIQETPIPMEENTRNERIQDTPVPVDKNIQNESTHESPIPGAICNANDVLESQNTDDE